jgi:DNA polymerase I-like protein with 3'-5' exonuclease and polymerase domains
MADYGIQDPEVTLALVEKIEAENYSEEALRLEHRVAEIIFLQERHGFYFDTEAAERLEIELTAEKARLEDELRSAFNPWFEPERYKGKIVEVDPKRRRTATVTSEDGAQWRSSYEPGEPYCKVKLVSFEPGSRDKIANRLKVLMGWTPVEFTPTGKPQIDETTLGGLDYPEAKLLIRYLTIENRLGKLATGKEAWLKYVKPDHRIHGSVNTNGAVTGRMTHSKPPMAGVPKVKLDEVGNKLHGYEGGYGIECRGLFGAEPGKNLVGVDAEGLELREMAHYMARYDGGAYAEAVVNGDKKLGTDAHSLNRKAIGLRTRDGAKTWLYAYVYGAGDLKLGKIHYDDMDETWREAFNRKHRPGRDRERALIQLGKQGKSRIERGIPALGALVNAVKAVARGKSKQLRSHDGRMLNIRAQHSALNTLLQGGGAVVMKKALVLAYDAFLARGWQHGREFAFVANVHDEFQMEVIPEHAEEVGRIAADAIRLAGEAFDLRCPLAGSADIGRTWADTH